MKIMCFGDESSLDELAILTSGYERKFVVAHNRPSAREVAESLGLDYQVHGRKDSVEYKSFLETVEKFAPDLILSFSYGLRIPQRILEITRLGGINFHGGLLPAWRGANIVNWVIIHDCRQSGVTAHWLTRDFDEGPVIDQLHVAISDLDTAASLALKLRRASSVLIARILGELRAGRSLPSIDQDESKAQYYRRRRPEDGLIDWTLSNREIFNLIRALSDPWPGAYTITSDGEKHVFREWVPLTEIELLRRRFAPNTSDY